MAINYPVNNFYQIIQQNAERSPRRIALFEDDLKISNEELLCRVDKVAAYLCDLEIKQGDKVALVMSNSWQFVVN